MTGVSKLYIGLNAGNIDLIVTRPPDLGCIKRIKMQSKKITIDGIGEVLLERSVRARYVNLSVRPFRGIRVAVPPGISFQKAAQVARSKADWLRQMLERTSRLEKQVMAFSNDQSFSRSRIGDISRSGHRLTAFSDSIIITTDQTEQGLMHLLQHVGEIGFNLACFGILYRGGIADGLVYYDEQQVFGPAVIEAYRVSPRFVRKNTLST